MEGHIYFYGHELGWGTPPESWPNPKRDPKVFRTRATAPSGPPIPELASLRGTLWGGTRDHRIKYDPPQGPPRRGRSDPSCNAQLQKPLQLYAYLRSEIAELIRMAPPTGGLWRAIFNSGDCNTSETTVIIRLFAF